MARSRLLVMVGVTTLLAGNSVAAVPQTQAEPSSRSSSFDDTQIEQIDELLTRRMRMTNVPGAALALIADGQVVLSQPYGVMRAGGPAVTRETRFSIGSVSKSITAATLYRLAIEGKLRLTDSPAQHLAQQLPQGEGALVHQITLAQLLNHTSGYATHTGNTNQSDRSHNPGVLMASARELLERGPDRAPGERWQYSNANYQLLGGIVEAVSERSFPAVVADKVFAPAGLRSASYSSQRLEQDAFGYQFAFGMRLENAALPGAVIAAQGGVTASIDDLARYLRWQMDRFDAQSWRQHYESAAIVGSDVRYSHGWFMVPSSNGLIVYHDGNNAGFTAAAAFNADQRTGVVVLANASSGYVGNDVDALTVGVRQMAMSMDVVSERNFGPAIGQLIGLMVLTALVLIWAVAFFRKPQRRAQNWLLIILPSAGLLLLAWLLGAALPQSLGATLDATRVFYPDAGMVLSAAVIACAVWGGVRMIILVLGKRA